MVRSCVLVCLLLLALATRTRAQEPAPRVSVVIDASEPVAEALREGLADQGKLPVELRLAPLPNAPRAGQPEDAELLGRLAAARARYIEADFEGCLARLPDDPALTDVIGRGQRVLAARTLLWRCACETGRGANAEATRAAQSFARMGFELPEDVGAVSPDVERLVTDALRAAQRVRRASVRVESRTEPAQVHLDGRPLGCMTPCNVEVLPGEHVLGLSGDGLTPSYVRTTLPGGAAALAPEPANPALAREQWSALRAGPERPLDDAASLRILSLAVPAQKLVLLRAEPVRDQRFELRGAYAIHGRVAARAGSGAVPQGDLSSEGRALVRELLVRGNTIAPPRPVWKSPWLWVGVGLGAAAAATATALLLQDPEQRTEIRFR